jgi:hypothetical protein
MSRISHNIKRGSLDTKIQSELTWRDKVFKYYCDWIYFPISDFFRYSKIGRAKCWLRCWWKGYHIIPTYPKLPAGNWYDCDTKIEHALAGILHSYISPEGEDAFNVVSWEGKDKEKKMIEDAHFFFTTLRPELVKRHGELLHKMYEDVDPSKPEFEPVKDGRNLSRWIPIEERLTEEQYAKHLEVEKQYKELEELIRETTTEHLCNIVKLRDYLWT